MDKLIPDLTSASLPLAGTETIELWQGGPESVMAPISAISSYVGGSFVPYTGALYDLNMGTFGVIAGGLVNIGSASATSQRQLRVGTSLHWVDVGSNALNSTAAIYLDQASPNPTNYALQGTSTITTLNAATTLNLSIGGASKVALSSSLTTFSQAVRINDGTQATGYVFTSDASGNGSWQPSAGGGYARSISTISTNTAAGSAASTDYYYECTANLTLTLPTAIGNTNEYTIKNNGGTPTVNTTSSQTIDGGLTAVLSTLYASITVYSNNSNWLIK